MSEDAAPKARISRRTLLAAAAVAGGTAVVGGLASSQGGPPTPSAMRSRTLGRTGLKVSEIGFGGYPIDDPDVLVYALERGINYVDTAHCYRGGASERAIGPALKGRRDRFVLTTKWCPHHIGKEPKRQVFLDMLDESLRRLGTDYVDIVLNHEVGRHSDGSGVERLKNPEMLEAFAVAKKAGKARFLGASGHDGDLPQVMGYAIDSGLFDVLLCRYSFLDYPEQQKLIDRAAAAGVGFIAMKTLAGAKGADLDRFRDRQTSFKQAALKWVLVEPEALEPDHLDLESQAGRRVRGGFRSASGRGRQSAPRRVSGALLERGLPLLQRLRAGLPGRRADRRHPALRDVLPRLRPGGPRRRVVRQARRRRTRRPLQPLRRLLRSRLRLRPAGEIAPDPRRRRPLAARRHEGLSRFPAQALLSRQ